MLGRVRTADAQKIEMHSICTTFRGSRPTTMMSVAVHVPASYSDVLLTNPPVPLPAPLGSAPQTRLRTWHRALQSVTLGRRRNVVTPLQRRKESAHVHRTLRGTSESLQRLEMQPSHSLQHTGFIILE